ncbi:hypothetical protein AB0F72_08845 [Actinoplanes sp. NPDC023936]|uniref:hypothetical protein n=1 Tax=Actinoplanes sp. NPDC023936 TaxID=3154910 RepID=UPI0034025EE0
MTNDGTPPGIATAFERTADAPDGKGEGGGRPAGPQACARAILTATQSDSKWGAAVGLWDRIRADIRRLPRDQEVAAWDLVHQALTELRADIAQQFVDPPEEVNPDVDH